MLRRFVPLMLCVVLALLVLVARLYEVTVEEHSIWAREAASLERSAHLVPYRRGEIQDRNGKAWVTDQVSYEIEFVWRDFRRGHPLGNIAQLMSLTLMRPVDLLEVSGGDAALWADHLVSLAPDEIREFARGGELQVGGVQIAALPDDLARDEVRQERRRRAPPICASISSACSKSTSTNGASSGICEIRAERRNPTFNWLPVCGGWMMKSWRNPRRGCAGSCAAAWIGPWSISAS